MSPAGAGDGAAGGESVQRGDGPPAGAGADLGGREDGGADPGSGGGVGAALVGVQLGFRYPGASRDAAAGVDIAVARGEAHAVAGANGSGRSTLLDLLAGRRPGGAGGGLRGHVEGAATAALVPSDPFLAQSGVRDTVRAELAFGLECRAADPLRIAERVEAALDAFGLAHLAERDPATLSGGEAARLALAGQWVVAPVTLLVDDLAAQLDRAGTVALRRCLADHVAGGGAAVWTTTRLDGLADAPAELARCGVSILVDGRLAARGALGELAGDARLAGWGVVPAAGPAALVAAVGAPDPAAVEALRPASPAALAIDGLCTGYPGAPAPAVDGASFAVRPGEVVALVGPNGGGKSTLARAAVGLLRPTAGAVRVGGAEARFGDGAVRALDGAARPRGRWAFLRGIASSPGRPPLADAIGPARGVGLAIQRPERMLFRRRVDDEVDIGLRWLGVPASERAAVVGAALRCAGLDGQAAEHPHDLLASQRRWLALAVVAALRTPVVVLDEPTAGFDAFDLARFARWLGVLRTAGRAVLWITHDHALATALADRAVRLAGGRVTADGPAAAVLGAAAPVDAGDRRSP